jgi:phosphoglycerol transferase MdoB-like AlkP superfamily enzyme
MLKRIVSSSESSFALFICLLSLTFAYRIQLTIGLFTNPVKPFDFNPTLYPVWFMLSYLYLDLLFIFVCFLLSWLLSRTKSLIKQSKASLFLRALGFVLVHIVLIIIPLVYRAHLHLLLDAQTGLDYFTITEAFLNISFIGIARLAEIRDYLFLLLPIGLFWLVLLSPLVLKTWMVRASFACIASLLLIPLFTANHHTQNVPPEIRFNPAVFLLSDVAEQAFNKHTAENRNLNIGGKEYGIHLTGPLYAHQVTPVKSMPPPPMHPWNIIFFVMESVGSRYIFDTSYGNPMPMPFLHRLSKESWHLKKHYTSSNVSPKAIFSLLSGHYDFFKRETFSIRSDARVPSINNFLPEIYDTFLITPSSISWYFPSGFMKNSGLSEIHCYENLNFKIKETYHSLGHYIARDEIQTIDFFINRLNQAREPFMGIYISFTAHFPYFDYGANYRIMENDGRLISLYYNNLNLLDQMIKRVYDHLQKQGLLERTIFIIVGDHGQAFGQHHPNNYMHYRYSYNENLEAPAFIYQPTLFKPRAIEFSTSHVDILPTVLDAMKIPFDPASFDGESLFQNRLRRKYIFFYGLEECISSLDTKLIKVQYSLKENRGWAFNLKIDPDEKNPLDVSSYRSQLEDLQRFVSHHNSNLIRLPTSSAATSETPSRGAATSKTSTTAPNTTSSRR